MMRPRERILAGAVGLLVAAWSVDAILIQPTLAWLGTMQRDTEAAEREIAEGQALIDRQSRIIATWRAQHAAGLLHDEATARFHGQQVLTASARSSGFVIASVGGGQLVGAAGEQHYDTIRVTISGQGSLAQTQAFLATLESSELPLCIERCELAASDPRKDLVDASIVVSTRIVADSARGGRGVPEGTVAWSPQPRDAAQDEAVLAARPFLADRSRPARPVASATETPVPASVRGWALVGVVVHDGDAVAFVRSLDDGNERQVRINDAIDGGTVRRVDARGMLLAQDADERLITVGSDLAGQPASVGPMRSQPSASPTSTSPGATRSPSPFQVPAVGSDPEREAILERLRQQRNRN